MRHAMPPSPDASSSKHPAARRPSGSTLLNVALVVLAVAAFTVIAVRRGGAERGVEVERRGAPAGIDEIRVHVSGAVAQPGVVVAQPGDRIVDVVDRAGGALPEANLDALNLALRIRDEDAVYVPFAGEEPAPLVDLNTATQAELEALPGIGPATARAIVAARPIASVDDLLERDLVAGAVWEEIRLLVTTR